MLVVVALGNPGDRYRLTPHNAGWIVADEIVASDDWSFEKYAQADIAKAAGMVWVKPKTYMNNSGEVLPYMKKQYDADVGSLVVLYDDLDLPFGQVKISHNRGDGGHNGIKSIARHFGSHAFTRIRIGIAPEDGRGHNFDQYVLSSLSASQASTLRELAPTIKDILSLIDKEGYEASMNRYNSAKPHKG